MKNTLRFLLALWVYTYAFAQITEVAKLPVQDIAQSIKESAPVWISENEIIIFFVNQKMDTIYSSRSTDRGKSWQDPVMIQEVNKLTIQDAIYLTALRISSGRILLAWSIRNESMKLIYSNDNGKNWSLPVDILGGGIPVFQKINAFLNLSQWMNGEICLSFYSASGNSYYRLSFDGGITWSSSPLDFPHPPQYRTQELTIISVDQNKLLGIYERKINELNGIDYRLSTDYGLSWSDPIIIADELFHEERPKVSKLDDGKIIVVYKRDDVAVGTSYGERNIYYKISSDNGVTWSEGNQFTKYIGDDRTHSIATLNNKTFVSFATERYSEIILSEYHYNIAYGVLQESQDKFTPPKIYDANVPQELVTNETFVYRIKAIDDEAVSSITVVLLDSAFVGDAFDDGLHNDGEANDSVFANTLPVINPRYIHGYNFNVNKIEMPMNNKGLLADVYAMSNHSISVFASDLKNNESTFKDNFALSSPGGPMGKFEEGTFLFSGGFFLSGYTGGTLWSNAVASSSLVEDYLPGTVSSDPDDPLNGIYIVSKDDIPFGPSWYDWKNAVSLGAEFYDGDGDGIYNPVDKNWNGTWELDEDMPMLIGDLTAWCVYNDAMPREMRRWNMVNPQGIEIRQTIFASNDPELENVIFLRYSILNTGTVAEIMDSVYLGIWEDADVGDAVDDIVGCDTSLQSGFYYADGPDWQYGENPPSFFTSLLQGPVIESDNPSDTAYNFMGELIGNSQFPSAKNQRMSSHIFFIGGDPDLNDPSNANEARNYLEGRTRTGFYPDPCSFPYCEVKGGIDCHDVNPSFWVSGDPVTEIGWISRTASDTRNLVSTGPFQLEKDKPQEIIIAYVIGRGSDPLNSITDAKENVQRAIQEYRSNFASMTYTPPAPTNPVNNYVLYQNYPNPFNPTTTIRYELPQDGVVTIEVFDILGQKVKTVMNEFKKADRYEVTFSSAGLASGVYVYQLRVNDHIASKKMMLIR